MRRSGSGFSPGGPTGRSFGSSVGGSVGGFHGWLHGWCMGTSIGGSSQPPLSCHHHVDEATGWWMDVRHSGASIDAISVKWQFFCSHPFFFFFGSFFAVLKVLGVLVVVSAGLCCMSHVVRFVRYLRCCCLCCCYSCCHWLYDWRFDEFDAICLSFFSPFERRDSARRLQVSEI